ncbi:MAG: S8 family serine peptidase [Candidatus Latescibacteria bacterium]|nr:S8 family serine peptidase [Candidatus Latescibacterota bacterium]NIM22392.1 S8 family serine peptidase [Candidatus Latescibacterota bacterium]NIM64752.1 S8 family serine peptidase [Candidatus Latescibacterota bacterium]NIO01263.1 S8 family serine peptidase [Candidatus Latescibacterota bacterium]NIO27755.1 S8 family serine peptidase [Candidatus Latescibacterota bacterium]
MKRYHSVLLTLTLAGVLVWGSQLVPAKTLYGDAPQEKIKIESVDQLPRRAYKVTGKVADLVKSEKAFEEFATKLRADIEADLAKYELEDKTTLRRWHATLVYLDMLDGRYDSALEGIERMRELQDKPAKKLTSGLLGVPTTRALKAAAGDPGNPIYKEVFRGELSARVKDLPWDIVQDEIEQLKGVLEMFGENLIMGVVATQIEPVVETTGELSADLALQVVNLRGMIAFTMPVRDVIIEELQRKIDEHRVAKTDIWAERSVALTGDEGGEPVLIAIWDTGVDCDVFKDIVYTNPKEKMDGKDNDGNGFVDDVHGVAYDMYGNKSPEILYPLGDAQDRAQEILDQMKGFFDLQAAIDSPEASALKKKFSAMPPEDVKTFLEDFMRGALYVHGTHVGGIAIDGNPYARLIVGRMEEDYHTIPRPPTMELAKKMAKSFKETVSYFKKHGVRAVNMSWGIGLKEVETQLEKNGIGETAEERAKIAREIFDVMREGLYSAIESTPDILFVVAAGNFNEDVAFNEDCPASFDLPNLLAVGAVDQTGRETGFTSFGDRVSVYSNGFEVESYVPGGARMAFSGTSMSSPNAINLAAKLIALDPSLSPPGVIALIEKGATISEGSKLLKLIHPKQSVSLLK